MSPINSTSQIANQVDHLMVGITAISAIVAVGIFVCIVHFCFRFHASRRAHAASDFQSTRLEVIWIVMVLAVFMGFYLWGSETYKKQIAPGKPDYYIFVFAKQWMWKFHHQNGFVEINELHLPVDKQVRFVMTSQDVIHSFFLPDFRIKQDVLPETYTFLNVLPEKEGKRPLFCAEYCGTDHSRMRGSIEVMTEKDYLELTGMGSGTGKGTGGKDLVSRGYSLYKKMGCVTCHGVGPPKAPDLAGVTDDAYIRESIFYPQKKVRKGFEAAMPSFKGQLSEEDIRALIEFIKTVRKK